MKISVSKGQKTDAGKACRRIFEPGTRQNISKQPFFKEK
jgi:hypothetical protein